MNLFELLCCGKTFCIPGSTIASHLCQNPAADETASIEKCLSYVTAMKCCYRTLLQKYAGFFYFENRVTLNLTNFHSLNKQEDHVEKNVSGDVVFRE